MRLRGRLRPTDDAVSCGRNGTCDGAGTCKLYPRGSSCGSATCTDNAFGNHSVVTGTACDGWGTCTPNSNADCGIFRCANGGCASSCATSAGCIDTAYCKAGVCLPKGNVGATCSTTEACASGFCVDSVCCNSSCTGTCQACSAAKKTSGTDGTCGPIGAGTDPDDECLADLLASCGRSGSCDGAGTCQLYIKGAPCGATQCSDNVIGNHSLVTGVACDGWGKCVGNSSADCGLFRCIGTSCAPGCTEGLHR